MRQPSLRLPVLAAVVLVGIAPAFAFDVPDGQSCGGLVCDLGLFGHKTAPAAVATPVFKPPRAVPAPASAAAAVPASVPIATADRPSMPRKHAAKPVAPPVAAKLALRPAIEAPAPAATRMPKPRTAVATSTLRDFVPTDRAMQAPVPPPPPPPEPVVLANPYVTAQPASLAFQSVDPTVGAR